MQSWYVGELDIKRRGGVVRVHDKYVSTPSGLARVELWRFRSGCCGRYVWHGGFAKGAVLVERKKFHIRDDLYLFGAEFRKLQTSRILVFQRGQK